MHHIVFVDDTPYNLELAAAYLEVTASSDINVNCFDQAESAISACRHTTPDLIFLDLEMPGKDGFETINELRTFCHAPIVAMTGHSEASIKSELIAYTFNDYLGKPFTDLALFNIVSKHIPGLKKQPVEEAAHACDSIGGALNIADMARRLRNNQKLIIRILDSFQNNNTHTFTAFAKALDSQDWVAAKRICHTLKGGGANIGAEALSDLAGQLEKTCSLRQLPSKSELTRLEQSINNAITQCRTYISTTQDAKPTSQTLGECYKTLHDELEKDLAAAQDLLFELEKKHPEDSVLRQCIIAFNEFRTDDVKSILENAISSN